MSAATVSESAPAPLAPDNPRPWRQAGRMLRMEIRHSAFVWCLPLLVVLFIYDPFRTAAGYPALWPVRSTVVLNKFWPDMVVFAAGFSAWAGSREGRRNAGDLLATTARPAWTRQLCSLAGTAFWVVGAFLAGVIALYVQTSLQATWGGPPIAPIVVGVLGLVAVCALAFTLGALFPGRFTAPIVAVALMIITLYAFRQAVGDNGGSSGVIGVLSPDGGVPGDDWGVFYPVSIGVPIVQGAFMAGVALAALGVLGLSPRTGGVGWRGGLSAVAAGGARLRAIAGSAVAVGVALVVAAFALAGTANVSDATSTLQIPALDNALAGSHPIPYTPVCSSSDGGSAFTVCLHPAYRDYLPQVTAALNQVMGELSGLPGLPQRASQISAAALPQWAQGGPGSSQLVGHTYEFVLSASVGWSANSSMIRNILQQDLTDAIIVGTGKTVTSPDGTRIVGPRHPGAAGGRGRRLEGARHAGVPGARVPQRTRAGRPVDPGSAGEDHGRRRQVRGTARRDPARLAGREPGGPQGRHDHPGADPVSALPDVCGGSGQGASGAEAPTPGVRPPGPAPWRKRGHRRRRPGGASRRWRGWSGCTCAVAASPPRSSRCWPAAWSCGRRCISTGGMAPARPPTNCPSSWRGARRRSSG